MDLAFDLTRPEHFVIQDQPRYRPPFRSSRLVEASDADPLAPDRPDDLPVLTTERRLRRLAILAADTGARFSREGIDHDAAAWVMAPRVLFDGATAIEAGQDLDHFARATLLHGLSIGLDAEPEVVDALLADETDEFEVIAEIDPCPGSEELDVRLFTCFVEGPIGFGGRQVNAFCAMSAVDPEAFRRRLRARFGGALADAAEIVEGLDGSHPLAPLLMSQPLREVLSGEHEASAKACEPGFDLVVDLRYRA